MTLEYLLNLKHVLIFRPIQSPHAYPYAFFDLTAHIHKRVT